MLALLRKKAQFSRAHLGSYLAHDSQFKKPAKEYEFWQQQPISCFDPAAQPIKTKPKAEGKF